MIYHNKCKQIVMGDLTKGFKVIGPINIGDKGFSIACGDLIKTGDIIELYCTNCSINVAIEDCYVYCSYCGKELPVLEALKPTKCGGLYCKDHIGLYNSTYKTIRQILGVK